MVEGAGKGIRVLGEEQNRRLGSAVASVGRSRKTNDRGWVDTVLGVGEGTSKGLDGCTVDIGDEAGVAGSVEGQRADDGCALRGQGR